MATMNAWHHALLIQRGIVAAKILRKANFANFWQHDLQGIRVFQSEQVCAVRPFAIVCARQGGFRKAVAPPRHPPLRRERHRNSEPDVRRPQTGRAGRSRAAQPVGNP